MGVSAVQLSPAQRKRASESLRGAVYAAQADEEAAHLRARETGAQRRRMALIAAEQAGLSKEDIASVLRIGLRRVNQVLAGG